jgi:excisionase family DNA binding protein
VPFVKQKYDLLRRNRLRGAQVQTDKKWLTIKEAASYIGMSVGFLRKNVRLRSVPYARLGSKALRFDRDALDAWISARSCGSEVDCGSKG